MPLESMAAMAFEKMRFARGLLKMRLSGMMGFSVRDSTQKNAGKDTVDMAMAELTNG